MKINELIVLAAVTTATPFAVAGAQDIPATHDCEAYRAYLETNLLYMSDADYRTHNTEPCPEHQVLRQDEREDRKTAAVDEWN